LRGEVGEADPELAVWWEALYQADDEKRRDLLDSVRETRPPRRVKRGESGRPPAGDRGDSDRPREDHASARGSHTDTADVGDSGQGPDAVDDGSASPDTAAPRKRRRRRRRPADSSGTPG